MFTPMLATDCGDLDRLECFVADDAWALEQKIDGHRRLLAGGPDAVMALNRRGERTDLPSAVRKAVSLLPEGFVLDGELLGNVLYVFDLPAAPPLIDASSSLFRRREVLEHFFGVWDHGEAIQLLGSATTARAKQDLVNRVVASGGEGFVAKRLAARYQQRRSTDWQKVKLTSCADVVVTAVSPDGRENYEVAVVDEDDVLRPVGSVAHNHRRSGGLMSVGDVAEVRYLYVGSNGRLVQPRIVRRRKDKAAAECTLRQLRPVNKAVVA